MVTLFLEGLAGLLTVQARATVFFFGFLDYEFLDLGSRFQEIKLLGRLPLKLALELGCWNLHRKRFPAALHLRE
jgi:hypothetical protein